MKQKIAIEPNLTPIKDYLTEKGYQVENINFGQGTSNQSTDYDAFVVTGLDRNFLGDSSTYTKAPVIDASGLTPQQVYQELQSRL